MSCGDTKCSREASDDCYGAVCYKGCGNSCGGNCQSSSACSGKCTSAGCYSSCNNWCFGICKDGNTVESPSCGTSSCSATS